MRESERREERGERREERGERKYHFFLKCYSSKSEQQWVDSVNIQYLFLLFSYFFILQSQSSSGLIQ
jgi:hypothetical protein